MENNRITFILPSRNNLELLKLAYQSIKDLKNEHDIIILDDARRKSEQQIINRWKMNFSDFNFQYFDNDKGVCIIKKKFEPSYFRPGAENTNCHYS